MRQDPLVPPPGPTPSFEPSSFLTRPSSPAQRGAAREPRVCRPPALDTAATVHADVSWSPPHRGHRGHSHRTCASARKTVANLFIDSTRLPVTCCQVGCWGHVTVGGPTTAVPWTPPQPAKSLVCPGAPARTRGSWTGAENTHQVARPPVAQTHTQGGRDPPTRNVLCSHCHRSAMVWPLLSSRFI